LPCKRDAGTKRVPERSASALRLNNGWIASSFLYSLSAFFSLSLLSDRLPTTLVV
jgi:hypothetical protein